MRRRMIAGWRASLEALGGAFSELLRAELAVLGDDLSRGGRRLGSALLLLAAALFVLFWAIGLLVYLAVEVAHGWLPRWAAVAVVLAVALLLMAILAAVGWRRLRSLEPPTALVQRRWSSHRQWWLDQFDGVDPEAGSVRSAARPGAGPRGTESLDEPEP